MCGNSKGPKGSQPGKVHEALDFNVVVGADVAYGTSQQGGPFHFMHFIDEATVYHVGAPSARQVENQIQTFLNAWWSGEDPCHKLSPEQCLLKLESCLVPWLQTQMPAAIAQLKARYRKEFASKKT